MTAIANDTAAHILVLEALTLATCPAEYETRIGGWVLRSSQSNVMRANTITIFADALLADSEEGNFGERLIIGVEWYARQGKKIHFRISEHPAAMAVDRALARYGYALHGATQVMEIADLAGTILKTNNSNSINSTKWHIQATDVGAATQWRMVTRGESTEIAMREADAARRYAQHEQHGLQPERDQNNAASAMQTWLDGLIAAAGIADIAATSRLPRKTHACAIYDAQQKQIAVGLARICGSHVGLFNIYTAPEYRGQGCGKRITQGLLAWARTEGARSAFLQVETENQDAIGIYERLGFVKVYCYHYRRQGE
jgi:ribosomal protein S18 acetylase RimI-like enzyme